MLGASGAVAADERLITLPSGAQVYLQERLEDNPGGMGLVQRYRYVMPDLIARLTPALGPAKGVSFDAPSFLDEEIHDTLIDPEELGLVPVITIPGTEEAADEMITSILADEQNADGRDALPPAPESLFREPVHDDIIWLCDHHILPEVSKTAQETGQIVVSVADRESEFGSYEPDTLQLFEVFGLAADRSRCEWKPW